MASGVAAVSIVASVDGAAEAVGAGAAESVFVEELRATTTIAKITMAAMTAATMRLEEPLFAGALFTGAGVALLAGVVEITVAALRAPEVGTGGTTKLEDARFATFFAVPFLTTAFLATFFADVFLAGAFLATFFFAGVFLATFFAAAFFAGAFLAVFFAADFLTATYLLLAINGYGIGGICR